jgi:thymidylate synthase
MEELKMSYADKVFKENLKSILEEGTSTKNQKVRPHWEDGTPAYTIKQFGISNVYDLRKEFPAITVRKTALKSCMDEILWIYQKKSNNINDLNSHIWDEWADKDGSIGKAYGYQVGKAYIHHVSDKLPSSYDYPSVLIQATIDRKYKIWFDQMDAVLYDLKNTPFSRRIMISLWNPEELNEMRLQPCCWSVIFNVTDEGRDKYVLNMVLNQRSNDFITANNWNTAQYAILLMMVAQSVNMIPGKLVHSITDCHVYDRHINIAKELINRPEHPAPKVSLNPEIHNFYDFKTSDLIVEDYETEPQIKNIPIAI